MPTSFPSLRQPPWYLEGVGNLQELWEDGERRRGVATDPRGGRVGPFWIEKSTLETRQAKEEGYRRAAAFFVELLGDHAAGGPEGHLRSDQISLFVARLQRLTGEQLEDPEAWVRWWKRHRGELRLSADGQRLALGGRGHQGRRERVSQTASA